MGDGEGLQLPFGLDRRWPLLADAALGTLPRLALLGTVATHRAASDRPVRRSGPFARALILFSVVRLKRDELRMNHHRALALCLRMIFSESRCTLFRIMR